MSYAQVETKNGEKYIYQGKIVQLVAVGGGDGCALPCGSKGILIFELSFQQFL